MPRFTARTAFLGRERLVSAFLDYYAADGHLNSSEMTYARWKVQRDGGASIPNIARLEAAAGIGILSNTVPSTFWILFEIYSRQDLLADLRKEIIDNALSVENQGTESASGVHVIDLAKIRDCCHKLVSTFQEMLRMRSNAVLTRVVSKDIMLNDEYHLRAGSVLQMSAHPINREASSWGDDSDRFDASRFMAQDDPAAKVRRRMKGYLSFGTSPNICPGRHFASGEILALAAMVILRYDITPEAGVWDQPKLNSKAVAATALPPLDAFNVKARKRDEYADTIWAFRVTEGKGKFNLITG
jgi:cytochrome P450